MSVSPKIRVGIAGKRGLAYVESLRALGSVEIAAFCDIDPQTLSREADHHGIAGRFDRFEPMLEQVDAAIVATPMPDHAEQSVLALSAGRHVLSEVTAAVSLDECWRLRDAALASQAVYMMAENYCYFRDNLLVRHMVREGLFGNLYYGEGEYLHCVRSMHHNADGSPTWRYFWQVGARGCTYGTHSLGPVMQWFAAADPKERIEQVVCLGSGAHTDPEHPHDDTCTMLCSLASGKLIRIRLDMISNRPHQTGYYSLQGTEGVYECSRFAGEPGRIWTAASLIGAAAHDAEPSWRPLSDFDCLLPDEYSRIPDDLRRSGHSGSEYFVARDFIRSIERAEPPPIDIYSALEWTAAGLCSQISIANGGAPIRVPNFRDPDRLFSGSRPVIAF